MSIQSIKEELLLLENQLLSCQFRKSEMNLREILADDFIEIGQSGRIYSKKEAIKAILDSPDFEYNILNPQIIQIAETVFLFLYEFKTNINKKESISLRSSLWIKNENSYQIAFHQGTAKMENV